MAKPTRMPPLFVNWKQQDSNIWAKAVMDSVRERQVNNVAKANMATLEINLDRQDYLLKLAQNEIAAVTQMFVTRRIERLNKGKRVSPLARSIANKEYIELEAVIGSGYGGAILKKDVFFLLNKKINSEIEAANKIPVMSLGTNLEANIVVRPGDESIMSNDPNIESNKGLLMDRTSVFIVHGRDELAKIEVARLIERLGFIPIILHEQASEGKTIIEKIEAHTNVGFGIVLYTPCDVGAVKGSETNLQSRARQNVVFEHGYLIGKLGRKNVCALVKGELEKPNDISGVVYTLMDEHEGWHKKVAKEMKACGYQVDMNKL